MKLAISGQALGEIHNLEEILILLNKLGVKWIEIWPVNLKKGLSETNNLEEEKRLLENYNIKVACVSVPDAFSPENIKNPKKYQTVFKNAIDIAVELKSTIVNSYFACFNDYPLDYYIETIKPVIEYARKNKVILVLENEAHDITSKAEGMLKVLKAVNSDNFRTNFDACNYYHGGDEGFPNAYNVLKDYISYVHIKNGSVFNPKFHSKEKKKSKFGKPLDDKFIFYPPIPEGAVNIEGLLKRLKEDHYEGFCTLEPHTVSSKLEDYYKIEVGYMRSHEVYE